MVTTQRKKNDQYFTPRWAIEGMLDHLDSMGISLACSRIFEPCCGDGAIVTRYFCPHCGELLHDSRSGEPDPYLYHADCIEHFEFDEYDVGYDPESDGYPIDYLVIREYYASPKNINN